MTDASVKLLDDGELQEAFALIGSSKGVVAAVSGGPDSMALMVALARWRALAADRPQIIVATVDHGLRPEAAQEAGMVGREASRLGLPFRLLRWQGDKPDAGIQEAARNERYRLLIDLCRREEVDALLTAHTLNDQAETVLMRLARGSGLSGLRGMETCRMRDGFRHLRPLLGFSKQRLVASCNAWDIPFVEDPSNDSDHYTRVRWRKLLPVLAREGLDAARLGGFAGRIARADEALEAKAGEIFKKVVVSGTDADHIKMNALLLYEEPLEFVIRVYMRALAHVAARTDHMRLQRLEGCVKAIGEALKNHASMRRTLGGAMISLSRRGELTMQAEPLRQRGLAGRTINRDIEIVADRVSALGKRGDNT